MVERARPCRGLLELKVRDPAIDSGHFLVGLADYLGDWMTGKRRGHDEYRKGFI